MSELDGTINVNDALMRLASINNELTQFDARRFTDNMWTTIGSIALCIFLSFIICFCIYMIIDSCSTYSYNITKKNIKYYIIPSVIVTIVFTIIWLINVNITLDAEYNGLIAEKEMLETYLRSQGYL